MAGSSRDVRGAGEDCDSEGKTVFGLLPLLLHQQGHSTPARLLQLPGDVQFRHDGGGGRVGSEDGVAGARHEQRLEMEEEEERGERVGGGDGGGGGDGQGRSEAGKGEKRWKGDRWTSHESMVLVTAKKQIEEDSISTVKGGDAKWKQIAGICCNHGVQRTSFQCRKRWNTLLTAYKKIKEWERLNGAESYWLMGGMDLRAKRLPAGFDEGIWKVMDSFLAGRIELDPKLGDAELDNPLAPPLGSEPTLPQPDDAALPQHGLQSATDEAPVRRKRKRNAGGPGTAQSSGGQETDRNVVGHETVMATEAEQKPAQRPEEQLHESQEGGSDPLDRFSLYMSSMVDRIIDCHDRNNELNRNLRREQGENMVAALGLLASAVRELVHHSGLTKY